MNAVYLVLITARQMQTVWTRPDRLFVIADLVTLEMVRIVVVGLTRENIWNKKTCGLSNMGSYMYKLDYTVVGA